MSFRIENKYEIHCSKLDFFYKFLQKKKAKMLFAPRVINSIYFDNLNLDSFKDSEEGVLPRKKIRLRYYGNVLNINEVNINYEVKFSLFEGRYKKVSKINNLNQILKFGVHDTMYNICKPKVTITYTREYLEIDNFRMTFDRNIRYQIFNSKKKFKDINQFIIEVKSNDLNDSNKINNIFPFKQIRYSKYSNAVKFLKIN